MISPEPALRDFYDSDTDSYLSSSLEEGEGALGGHTIHNDSTGYETSFDRFIRKYRYRKVLVPSQEHLQSLPLRMGANEITFEVAGCPPLKSQLFVWPQDAKIVLVDVEGLTYGSKAAVVPGNIWQSFLTQRPKVKLGQVAPPVDLPRILTDIAAQGYRILYMAQSIQGQTKDYLSKISATTGSPLPSGPIFQSPDSLVCVYYNYFYIHVLLYVYYYMSLLLRYYQGVYYIYILLCLLLVLVCVDTL